MLVFDLQTFGGGKKSKVKTTPAQIPQATAEEQQLLNQQLDWFNQTKPIANRLLNMGNTALNTQVNPDYNSIYGNMQTATDANANRINGLFTPVTNAQNTANNANNGYINNIGNAMDSYSEGNKYLDSDYQKAMQDNANTMNGLLSGNLPDAYATNRRNALMDDMNSTVGNTLSHLASRGIIDSSVSSSALNDISRNASNTLANSYSNDMSTAASLANNAYNNQLNGLNGRAGLLGDQYANAVNGINAQAGLTGQNYSNALRNAGTIADLTGQAQNYANAGLTNASNAQNAALNATAQYLEMANNLNEPARSLLASMRGQRYALGTPAQTYVKQGSGGLFGNLMSAGTNALATRWGCFPAGIMVATPEGEKPIETIKSGDIVISYRGHTTVKALHEIGRRALVKIAVPTREVITTLTQTFKTPDGIKTAKELKPGDSIYTVGGYHAIASIGKTGEMAEVYDLELANDGWFYANGILAESIKADELAQEEKEGE